MKIRTKTILLSGIMTMVIGVQAFAISLDSNSTGKAETTCYCKNVSAAHTIGVGRDYGWASGDTYGYSWVGCSGKSLSTTTHIGTTSRTATGVGWAQTNTLTQSGQLSVSETHKQVQ